MSVCLSVCMFVRPSVCLCLEPDEEAEIGMFKLCSTMFGEEAGNLGGPLNWLNGVRLDHP